jgi:HPt (histidine-containing phosphotransfer) domain-containing protein
MSELVDAETLDVLIDAIGADAARGVIELFLGESRDLTAAISAPDANPAAVGRAAHSLKSSAAQLGALALSEAARAVETAAASGSAGLPQLIAALGECAEETRQALGAKLG